MGLFSCITWELLVAAYRIYFPDQESNPGPLHWKCGSLAPGSPRKSRIIFSISIYFWPSTLVIQGEPWLLKPLFQVPSQFCVLHKAGCSSSTIIPALGSRQLSPHQTSCHLFHLVFYDFLTLSCSQMTFCMFILFPDFFFFTIYQREAGNQNFLSNYYGLIPCLVLYTWFHWVLTALLGVECRVFYKWETGSYTQYACYKLVRGPTLLVSRGARLLTALGTKHQSLRGNGRGKLKA